MDTKEVMPTQPEAGLSQSEQNMRVGNISLILDSYDDIFSDFDPRPYTEKAISDDFLIECKRAAFDKPIDGEIDLRILVPKKKRKIADEIKIRKRLKNHFLRHYHMKEAEKKESKREGAGWFGIGGILIFMAIMISENKGFIYRFLLVLLEPAGWFTVWTGLEKIFLDYKGSKPELDFYTKMNKAKIYFLSY